MAFNSSSPEISRSPFAPGSAPGSLTASASIPYSYSPSPQYSQHPGFGSAPSTTLSMTQASSASTTATNSYMPPSVNPWAHTVIRPSRKRKSDCSSGKSTGTGRKKRVADATNEDGQGLQEESGQSGSSRGYARWDTKRDDGLTVEACLVQWMSRDGNWRRWKDAKSTGEKDKCLRSINAHIIAEEFQERTRDSIVAKFKALEDSYKKALLWQHSTGSGSYSTVPDDENDERSSYQRELEKRCRYWDQLQLAFGERAGMMPRRIYSSIESDAMREADLDLRRLLGLSRFEDEEGGGKDDKQTQQSGDHTSQLRNSDAASLTEGGKQTDRSQGSRAASVASSSRSHRSSVIPNDVLQRYLTSKQEMERQKLEREEKEDRRQERRLVLEEQKHLHSQQLQRAEIISTYLKAGLNILEATKAYEDGKQESERAAAQLSQEPERSGSRRGRDSELQDSPAEWDSNERGESSGAWDYSTEDEM